MRRTTCSACGYDDLEMFLDLGLSPIADAYTTTPDEEPNLYPLQLAVCTGCWLVQLLDVVEHHLLFGTGYSFYTSASPPLSAYHAEYAADVLREHRRRAKQLTVEIGCNDGDFLRHFRDADCPVVGVDPAEGPAWKAIERGNIPVLIQPFDVHVAERIRNEHGPAGVVIANHVLAHVESVSDVLAGIRHLLDEDGVAYIEVQYLPDLLVNNAFDLVYHEHRNFFSLTSLENAARHWGLRPIAIDYTDRQGGSIRMQLARGERDLHLSQPPHEVWLRDVAAYRGFQGRVDRIRKRLQELVWQAASSGRMIGYGAPAKATTLLNYCGFGSDQLDLIVDTTTAKWNRFVPGTGVQIINTAEVDVQMADTILLLAWNYLRVIRRNHADFPGDWIVPIPAPVVL